MNQEQLKNKIVEILYANSETSYSRGSCGELGDSFKALDADYFSDVADDIIKLLNQ